MELLAAIEEGGEAFIALTIMVVVVFVALFVAISR